MKIPKRVKARSRKLSAKGGKTVRTQPSPQLIELIKFANLLGEMRKDLCSLNVMADRVRETSTWYRDVPADSHVLLAKALGHCMEGLPEKVRAFITETVGDDYVGEEGSYLFNSVRELSLRYENLRISLHKLTSLAHANKLSRLRNEQLDNDAALAREYWHSQAEISGVKDRDDVIRKVTAELLGGIKNKGKVPEWLVAGDKMQAADLQQLIESIRRTVFTIDADEIGDPKLVKYFFNEALEGIEEEVFRIRECIKCPQVFWARYRNTVACPQHRKDRRNERRDFGTKRARLSGAESKKPPKR